jgi:hypothetical protein
MLRNRGKKLICFVVLDRKEQLGMTARQDHLLELGTNGNEVDVRLDCGALWV